MEQFGGQELAALPPPQEEVAGLGGLSLRDRGRERSEVQLVSNETGKGINHAVNAIIEHRSGMDVHLGARVGPTVKILIVYKLSIIYKF